MLWSSMFFSIILLPFLIHRSSGVESSFTTSEEDGEADAYPSYTRKDWNVDRQGFKPWNSEMLFDAAFGVSDSGSTNDFPKSQALLQKRRSMKLIPRIGRKKRSIKDKVKSKTVEESDQELNRDNFLSNVWNQESDRDTLAIDKRKPRRGVVFIPRIGKRLLEDEENVDEKRAIFIPRVGRSSSISKIIRYNPNMKYRVVSRAIFIPRIG